jgi:hypothetical protein
MSCRTACPAAVRAGRAFSNFDPEHPPITYLRRKKMLKLSADPTFHYELLRVLGTSRDRGADAGEVLTTTAQIIPGDFDSWYIQFAKLADHVLNSVDQQSNLHPVSIRNAMFRAATYYRAADFFLHGNPDDFRIYQTWNHAIACFDRAISLVEIPGERFEIDAGGFQIPGIFYRVAVDDQPLQLVEALGERATYRKLSAAGAAGEHCHVGASDVLSRVVMNWLDEALQPIGPYSHLIQDGVRYRNSRAVGA